MRSLATEVTLRDDEPPGVEQFLQTRTVSLEEAGGELESWRQAAEDELEALESLESTTGAVERVTVEQVKGCIKSGGMLWQLSACIGA